MEAPRHIALLGHPVSHSVSPLMHNAAFEALGLPHRYVATDVPPTRLADAVLGLHALGFGGANVTIPHKEAVATLCRFRSEEAQAVGAVNTLVIAQDGAVHGANTDVDGFAIPLAESGCSDRSAVVLGAGGAARAVVYALLTRFDLDDLCIVGRSEDRAHALVEHFGRFDPASTLRVAAWANRDAVVQQSLLVVNATPVGMHPNGDACPLGDTDILADRHFVYDLVYRPGRTRLLEAAANRGARILGGLPMLMAQAAGSFKAWTGRAMPLDAVRGALWANGFGAP